MHDTTVLRVLCTAYLFLYTFMNKNKVPVLLPSYSTVVSSLIGFAETTWVESTDADWVSHSALASAFFALRTHITASDRYEHMYDMYSYMYGTEYFLLQYEGVVVLRIWYKYWSTVQKACTW